VSDEPYHVIDPRTVEEQPERPDMDPKPDPIAATFSLSDVANFEILGMRYNVAEPGEQIPLVYHYHEDQEEAFYVLSGTMHVETPAGEYVVEAGEMFAVEADNPHRAYVPADASEPAAVLSFGAPSDDTGVPYEA
jgi:uncharacterized cupin superfamily protein